CGESRTTENSHGVRFSPLTLILDILCNSVTDLEEVRQHPSWFWIYWDVIAEQVMCGHFWMCSDEELYPLVLL
ncbi:17740_t:CDS:1, partial [Racocetra persica]